MVHGMKFCCRRIHNSNFENNSVQRTCCIVSINVVISFVAPFLDTIHFVILAVSALNILRQILCQRLYNVNLES
ncbi:CLUMA_CG014620, isoform A [Clunio marinus]|uniref:CLUMA_CG014620, isoform A n=1 Tax=Clunio marinus TaxID=568069 RepID=A0A1J1INW1_9DIPT|nr:CLUMA_CG014620, isoform A [Clunio marinus]